MKDYMAPMEGVTNFVYRRAYHRFYHPMDKYFTPFISAKPKKNLSFQEICEVSPERNEGMYVVPQILTCNAEDFIRTAQLLKEDYGHQEVNLNLGCPSGTVTAKGKGAGFLAEPQKLDAFLDEIFSKLDMKISIKTRIGTHSCHLREISHPRADHPPQNPDRYVPGRPPSWCLRKGSQPAENAPVIQWQPVFHSRL